MQSKAIWRSRKACWVHSKYFEELK